MFGGVMLSSWIISLIWIIKWQKPSLDIQGHLLRRYLDPPKTYLYKAPSKEVWLDVFLGLWNHLRVSPFTYCHVCCYSVLFKLYLSHENIGISRIFRAISLNKSFIFNDKIPLNTGNCRETHWNKLIKQCHVLVLFNKLILIMFNTPHLILRFACSFDGWKSSQKNCSYKKWWSLVIIPTCKLKVSSTTGLLGSKISLLN